MIPMLSTYVHISLLTLTPLSIVPQKQVSSEKVEHAIEEEPSEIYIKEELTLDIPFAVQVRARSEMDYFGCELVRIGNSWY